MQEPSSGKRPGIAKRVFPWAASDAVLLGIVGFAAGFAVHLYTMSPGHDQDAGIPALRAQVEQARAELARVVLEQERLRRELAWRRFSREQCGALSARLPRGTEPLWIGTVKNDPEATLFWQDIVQCLKDAGVRVTAHTGYEMAIGLSISPANRPGRRELIEAFTAAGLPLEPGTGDGARMTGTIEIVIGSKPPPS